MMGTITRSRGSWPRRLLNSWLLAHGLKSRPVGTILRNRAAYSATVYLKIGRNW